MFCPERHLGCCDTGMAHVRTSKLLAAIAALTAGLAMTVGAAAAQAAPAARASTGLHWSGLKTIDPRLIAGIGSVSCPTTQFCAGLQDSTVTTFDGHGWSSPQPIIPIPDSQGMNSISCASASFCAAVGELGEAPF